MKKKEKIFSKRVCIVTLTKVYNYGNSLQNYALQQVICNLGFHCETMITEFNTVKDSFKNGLRFLIKGCILGNDLWERRKIKFHRFEKNHIYFSKYKNVYNKNSNINTKYDYFVVGSDQVWNPSWYTEKRKHTFLLTFADENKKISYSASFGVDILPKEWVEWFKSNLLHIPYISVREDSGAKIINDLIGNKAAVLIDPTLLLEKDDWMSIMSFPSNKQCENPYMFTYFLGGISNKTEEYIYNISNAYKLKVIDILDKSNPEIYVSGPEEFLYLIYHAKLVMTDSFHACVFSFLFEKAFLVFPRLDSENDMTGRIRSLLKTFDIENKYIENKIDIDIFDTDYSKGKKKLEQERRKAINFLKMAFDLE